MMARMKAKWKSKEDERVTSQSTIVEDFQKMLGEVISKVVEDAEVMRSVLEGNEKEDLSASVTSQVLFHLCNFIKYLIYFWFVR